MSSLAHLITAAQDRLRDHPSERAGQAAFNALAEFDPALAVEITGTERDPFYDNARLCDFWLAVADDLCESE